MEPYPSSRHRAQPRCVASRTNRIVSAGVLALGLALAQAPADGDEVQGPLTLAEARKLALERNADFRVAEAQVSGALAKLRVAREFPNPTLGLSTAKISPDGTPESTALGNGLLSRSYDS